MSLVSQEVDFEVSKAQARSSVSFSTCGSGCSSLLLLQTQRGLKYLLLGS